jgi:pimeloyl-ACP methyl ester carboxylesterase
VADRQSPNTQASIPMSSRIQTTPPQEGVAGADVLNEGMPSSDSGLAWIEVGAPDGRPVVFLHGWPSSRLMGRVWAATAARRGWRVLAPDRPGIGRSPRRDGWSFTAWPPVLERFLDERGLVRCPIIGLSGGGPYALASGVLRPDRITAVAVISGAPPLDDRRDHALIMAEFRVLAAVERRAAGLVRAGFRVAGPVLARFDVPLIRNLMRVFGRQPDEAFMASRASDTTLSAGIEGWRQGGLGVVDEGQLYLHPWGFEPEAMTRPTAFWHGTKDPFFHWSLARQLADRVPGAAFHEVAGEGHFTPIYRVQDSVFDWLDRVAAASS